jgi:hypothetical protein
VETKERHSAGFDGRMPGRVRGLRLSWTDTATRDITVTIHYDFMMTCRGISGNGSPLAMARAAPIMLDRFTSERLAVVEAESAVDERPIRYRVVRLPSMS